VNFSAMDGAIGESDLRNTFPLAPTPSAIDFSKPGDLADSRPNRKCFNLRDWAEQLKIHEAMVPKLYGIRQWERLNGEESAGPPRAAKCWIARPDPTSLDDVGVLCEGRAIQRQSSSFVWSIWFISFMSFSEPYKQKKPNKPDEPTEPDPRHAPRNGSRCIFIPRNSECPRVSFAGIPLNLSLCCFGEPINI
jgi:hypothetical protein